MKPPAVNPCGSCPYRRDVPSGVWHEDEYAKLPTYDGPMYTQPQGVFMCHQNDGCMCAGWTGCHDMTENLSVRIAVIAGHLSPDDFELVMHYFHSGSALCIRSRGCRPRDRGHPDTQGTGSKDHRQAREEGSG